MNGWDDHHFSQAKSVEEVMERIQKRQKTGRTQLAEDRTVTEDPDEEDLI